MTLSEFNAANGNSQSQSQQPAGVDIEQILKSTGTAPPQGSALIDFHNDMKESLPAARLRRNDTDDSGVDEFVDAQG